MGNPFTSTSVSSYNSNPPSDDGSQTASNRLQWSTHKTKLSDPIKTAFDTSETATNTAFGKVIGGGGITTTAVDYTITSSDQGKFIKATASLTLTTPDATSVDSPFVFFVVNTSTGDVTVDGNGSQTIDGSSTITIPAGGGCAFNTDGSNWFTGGQNFVRTPITPQGRLTLITNSPFITSDQSAETAVFWTPYQGNLVPIPNGSTYDVQEFSQLTLTLNGTNYTASAIFDVFFALDPADGTTQIIGSGPAWSTATAGSGARGTGAGTTELTTLKGFYVNKNAITLRNNTTTYSVSAKSALYLGSIAIDGTAGQVSCRLAAGSSRIWGVWNAFNRGPITMRVYDSTSSWTYAGASYRASRNDGNNLVTTLIGLQEENIDVTFVQQVTPGSSDDAHISIGVNSQSSASGVVGRVGNAGKLTTVVAHHLVQPAIGKNNIYSLEAASGSATNCTFQGTESGMQLIVTYMG